MTRRKDESPSEYSARKNIRGYKPRVRNLVEHTYRRPREIFNRDELIARLSRPELLEPTQ